LKEAKEKLADPEFMKQFMFGLESGGGNKEGTVLHNTKGMISHIRIQQNKDGKILVGEDYTALAKRGEDY